MRDDLSKDFWNKVQLTPKRTEVVELKPSIAEKLLQSDEPRIYVSTFSTLNQLRREYKEVYESLAARLSLTIVDEGHYEPAVEWGKSVKGLTTKTVLLTATPYRNDLKLFRITEPESSTFHFKHKDAVERGIIRDLVPHKLGDYDSISDRCAAFARFWIDAKARGVLPSKSPRAIVCCSSASEIRTVVDQFSRLKIDAIGVHEQFNRSKSKKLLKSVPDPKKVNAEVWVHQYKLTEGLDDHRFCCVSLFTNIQNDRRLVQQVGRVLRRDAGDSDEPAVLLFPDSFPTDAQWEAYLDFETRLSLLEPQHFRTVVETMLAAQPEVEYFGSRFRRKFDPSTLDESPQVLISPSAIVRAKGDSFDLSDYIEDTTDTLNTQDGVILGPDINGPCTRSDWFALWVYASIGNSRSLQSRSLYEIKLETHCVVVWEDVVLISDSTGGLPLEYLEQHTRRLDPGVIGKFLGADFSPTLASLNSSIPYETVVRGQEMRGSNLLAIPTSLTDRIQICRAARGTSRSRGRRYVGLSNGRLRKETSEVDRSNFDLREFLIWARETIEEVQSDVNANRLFERFMPTCRPPIGARPRSICVDLLKDNTHLTRADGHECATHQLAAEVEEKAQGGGYSCEFLIADGSKDGLAVKLDVAYQPSKVRYWFKTASGSDSVHVSVPGESRAKGLAEFLNQHQEIVLVGMSDGETVYQGRNFYRVDYSFAEASLVELIESTDGPACSTEKGTKEQIAEAKRLRSEEFPSGSLFRAIAENRIQFDFGLDVLICDDLNTECADFVAASFERHELALIHAKVGDVRTVSASSFHDVVAQAMKNLVYLTRARENPSGVSRWRRDSVWNKTGVRRLQRLPEDEVTAGALWSRIRQEIIESSEAKLYVVLVTAGCCNKDMLLDAVRDPTSRSSETAQLFHLLDGLHGYARQLGVNLRIYDLPKS